MNETILNKKIGIERCIRQVKSLVKTSCYCLGILHAIL